MSLEVQGLGAGYGATTVLRDVSLVVPPGTVATLLGPNGAGKTTLLRCCSGLLRPSAGRVVVDGSDLTHASPSQAVRHGVCHLPERRGVFPALTVLDNLRAFRGDLAIEEAVEAFPVLGRKLRQSAGSLSGGEQQMLALARAYVTDPAYVLVDEVSTGLAPKVIEQILEFLRGLAARGVALLLVEQYVALALEVADLAYVLTKGRIVFRGEACELDQSTLAAAYLGRGPVA